MTAEPDEKARDVFHGCDALRAPVDSPAYLIRCIHQFQLWTRADWERAHEKLPHVIPSIAAVKRVFGSWACCKQAAKLCSFEKALDEYLRLRRKLLRNPTSADLRREQLLPGTFDKLKEVFQTRAALLEFVGDIERLRQQAQS